MSRTHGTKWIATADGVRWFMLAAGSAWLPCVSDETINEVVRKTLLTHWNTASFLSLYRTDRRIRPP